MPTQSIAVQQLVGAQASEDGKAMLLDLKDAQGADLRLAVPHGELMPLVSLATVSHSAGMQIQKVPGNVRHDFNIAFWSLSKIGGGSKDVILDLTLRQSGTLSFRLDETQQRELHAALATLVDQET